MPVVIHKNPNGDTRTAPKNITFKQFQEANDSHIADVKAVMDELGTMLCENGEKHDWTKKKYEKMFFDNFLATMNTGTDFVSGKWYQLHVNVERHHLISRCSEDVNLLDVIEMIVDCVCAGKTRSGEIRGLEMTPEILEQAVRNTIKLVDDMTVVK